MTEGKFERCIRAMNRGDKSGLKEVYEEYASYIYGIVRQHLSNREEAEDITSEFFIRLWEKSDTYKPGKGHKGWMATIARNLAVDFLRKKSREELVDFQAERMSEQEDGGQGQLLRQVERNAGQQMQIYSVEDTVVADITMKEALATLKEEERTVLHLKIMGGYSFKEIAELLGKPQGTVAWYYREAIKKLRRCGYEESGNGI